MTAIQKELDAIKEAAEQAELAVVARYRDKYIVPYCNRHRIKLIAGMGEWYLVDEQGRTGDVWEGRPIPVRVREVLEAKVINRCNDAGSLMENYTPPGWRNERD